MRWESLWKDDDYDNDHDDYESDYDDNDNDDNDKGEVGKPAEGCQ